MRNELGNKYERWTVIAYSHYNERHRSAYWLCRCTCGNVKKVNANSLRAGTSKSCGCIQKEIAALLGKRKGKEHASWRGGKITDGHGYTKIKAEGHKRADKWGYVREHILVMEKMLGRSLNNDECVHHCNGDKSDNRPYNLRLFATSGKHTAYHFELRRQ